MDKDSFAQLINEIGFATFRVAETVDFSELRKELGRAALGLVSEASVEAVDKLERLIVLARAIEEMNEINAGVLLREINNLRTELVRVEPKSKVEVDISKIFARKTEPLPFSGKSSGKSVNKRKASDTPGKRQAEILEFIRQFPDGCRISDITRNFDEVSKRTVRNDISALVDEGQAERVGGKGPNSYIKAAGGIPFGGGGASEEREEVILLREPERGQEEPFD